MRAAPAKATACIEVLRGNQNLLRLRGRNNIDHRLLQCLRHCRLQLLRCLEWRRRGRKHTERLPMRLRRLRLGQHDDLRLLNWDLLLSRLDEHELSSALLRQKDRLLSGRAAGVILRSIRWRRCVRWRRRWLVH